VKLNDVICAMPKLALADALTVGERFVVPPPPVPGEGVVGVPPPLPPPQAHNPERITAAAKWGARDMKPDTGCRDEPEPV
jgi:hypothetical protein